MLNKRMTKQTSLHIKCTTQNLSKAVTIRGSTINCNEGRGRRSFTDWYNVVVGQPDESGMATFYNTLVSLTSLKHVLQ